ncbi:peroxiredoxin [Methylohalomonas lacus]|uniref:Peroxiredoxin n=1 Tax=Methylohalomonas lacus TaxID=398773 RepID=A0AAE3L166_9GAMM|nr:peroxiredoxin [Methylohalomonas lacus]
MSLSELPPDLPAPVDDGAADHLIGCQLPAVVLTATGGEQVALAELEGLWVLYVYPMTGRPDEPLPDGWDRIPGARGCTPQACAFRDHHAELQALNAGVYGISTQSVADQYEAKMRLHLPFELLSDTGLLLGRSLQLPTFVITGRVLYRRLTLIADKGRVVKTFYPVFPPDENADQVIHWLRCHTVNAATVRDGRT